MRKMIPQAELSRELGISLDGLQWLAVTHRLPFRLTVASLTCPHGVRRRAQRSA
jgi:hypothetical protein